MSGVFGMALRDRTRVTVIFSHREIFSSSREFYRLYYPLCVSRRIDTWQIVYLSYKDHCPTISIHKSEI